ncbi:aldehyde dehydrogenase family protein [Romboutsia lituseburensis]|uniref:aldehyde dehydrogenase family protein n=1 Tax=Romboutsia lituseburensis TaxID=1537 RepID=UPI00215A45D7|nr:aldehyde dehydrogenase family protein [Romboutsia lituseburensis]MCR8744405.1 aldehyde dehydrogenase family protein [Romboutsia lituseburensis]
MQARDYVLQLINKARIAQREFEKYSQNQVDEAVRAIGKSIYDNGEMLARMAVDETKMGVYEDKIVKNKGKSKAVWNKLKGVKSRGIIKYIAEEGLVEVAKPIGVVGAVTPTTNPTMTPMHNAMIALKGGNSIIICPHPRAKNTGVKTVDLMREALEKVGAPKDLIQIVNEPTVEISNLVMQLSDVCVSTGGPGMVKVAYSSGKPAFGVGAGNVQCLIDKDANLDEVVPKVIKGRIYDNGILCTCEQSAICPNEMYNEFIARLVQSGAYYIEKEEEVKSLRKALFPDGNISKDCVGASPYEIAKMASIEIPKDTKLLVVKAEKYGTEEYFAKEKMCPVLSAYKYDKWEEAVNIANQNLEYEGKGHSAIIHSYTKENIEYAANILPVSRFGVNQIGSSGLGGSFLNGLNPTATLGCGSWGNNSISENLWFNHLINISKIAYEVPSKQIPTDDEIWN